MKFAIAILLSALGVFAFAQKVQVFPGSVETCFTVDEKTYLVKNGGVKYEDLVNGVAHIEYYHILYRDSVILDTLSRGIDKFYSSNTSDSIYFTNWDDEVLMFDLQAEKFKNTGINLKSHSIHGLYENEFLAMEYESHYKRDIYFLDTEVRFIKINPYSGEKTKIYSFNNLLKDGDMPVKVEYFPYSGKLRLFTGVDPGQGAGYLLPYKSFLVDLRNKTSIESDFISSYENENLHRNKGYFIGGYFFFDITCKYKFVEFSKSYLKVVATEFLVIDSDLNKVPASFLPKGHNVKGVVYKENNVDAFWILSSLDTKPYSWSRDYTEVVIAYAPTLETEQALYNIYNNNPIDSKTLRGMRLENLLILKNMIWAKHNFKFESSFYQAFFNFFTFYNNQESRKTRKADMADQFTDVDRKNLQEIDEALKKHQN
ncbi:MAG: YARHG domain-containing protein [Cyclobacteriaceae bacterium]|nr:YARHG domain-containing protein [Cyclobacteriaceae bacterium]